MNYPLVCLLFTCIQVCVFAENATAGPEYEAQALDILNSFYSASSNPGGRWHQGVKTVNVPFGITHENEAKEATLVLKIANANLNALFGHVSAFRLRQGTRGNLGSWMSVAPFSFALMPTEAAYISFAGEATLNMVGQAFGPYQVFAVLHGLTGAEIQAEYINGMGPGKVNIYSCQLSGGDVITVKYLDANVADMLKGFTVFPSSPALTKLFQEQIVTQMHWDLTFSLPSLRQLVTKHSFHGKR
ncbi:hypothetical protein HDE_06658 [Halotydeus destructor]|nr:hypothetical protein HDE_06658 [Halotydeus destructor]